MHNCSNMTVAICTLWYKEEAGENIDAEDEDCEEDAAIEDVVEEPVEFADPEDDEFELEEF